MYVGECVFCVFVCVQRVCAQTCMRMKEHLDCLGRIHSSHDLVRIFLDSIHVVGERVSGLLELRACTAYNL